MVVALMLLPVPPLVASDAPTGFTVTPGDGEVTATWTPVPGALSYGIRIEGAGDPWDHLVKSTATSTTITGLDNGVRYTFRIRACRDSEASECGAWTSMPAEATPSAPVTTPVSESGRYSVTSSARAEEGDAAKLTVSLDRDAPTGGVEFTVTAAYSTTGAGAADAGDVGSLTSPVTVPEGRSSLEFTVATEEDDVDESEETFTVVVTATTDGWTKEGEGKDTATITIGDDDSAGVTVAPDTVSVTEGSTVGYTVTLDSRPTADVTVLADLGEVTGITVTPASHTFGADSATDWKTAKTFTVAGLSVGGYTIGHQIQSRDADYGGTVLTVEDVGVTVTAAPSDDSTLSGLAVADDAGAAISLALLRVRNSDGKDISADDYQQDPSAHDIDRFEYAGIVPMDATGVKVTATAADNASTVAVDDETVTSGTQSKLLSLQADTATTITVVVTAASGDRTTYTVLLERPPVPVLVERQSSPQEEMQQASPPPGGDAADLRGRLSPVRPDRGGQHRNRDCADVVPGSSR